MTLSQYATQSNDPLVREIAFSMIKAGSVFADIPLMTDPTMVMTGSRVLSVPKPHWAKLNQEPQPVIGKAVPFTEQGYIIRDEIDIDHYFYKDKNAIGDPFDLQIEMYLRGLSYDLNDKIINNDHNSGDPNAFVGVRSRLDNPQFYGAQSACKIDASGVDMSGAGITSLTANKLIYLMQQMCDELGTPDGTQCVLYANDDLLRRIEQGIRTLGAGGGFDLTKDAFDRRFMTYKNAKVMNIGRKAPLADGSQADYIISSNETPDGKSDTGGSFTSMYGIKHGKMDFCGWQFAPLKPTPPEKLNNGVTYRVVMDWMIGLYIQNNRSMARIYDIHVGA